MTIIDNGDGQVGMPAPLVPDLPPIADVAAMLRAGEHLTEIADIFDTPIPELRTSLHAAGWDPSTGESDHPGNSDLDPFEVAASDENDAWKSRGLCSQVDPELFFPEKGGSTREAKQTCMKCEVRAECLDAALENDERFGIWGGLSERERRTVKRHLADTTPHHAPDEPKEEVA